MSTLRVEFPPYPFDIEDSAGRKECNGYDVGASIEGSTSSQTGEQSSIGINGTLVRLVPGRLSKDNDYLIVRPKPVKLGRK